MNNPYVFKALRALLVGISFILSTHIQAEVTLNMLTWEGYSPDEQVKRFQKLVKEKYNEDLTFNITYISSADEYFEKIRRKTVDIIAPSHNIIKDQRYKLITEELILPIDIKNIPNYSKLLPTLQNADYTTVNGKLYSVPLVHGPYGLAYNVAKVPSPPESWNIFWDPKFKGKYTISSDYSEVNIYITALAAGLSPKDITDIKKLNSPEISQRLTQLIKNANNLWKGVDSADDFENNAIGAAWGFSFPELAKRGQIWKMADPKEGTTGWVDGHAITYTLRDKPKHKRIAEEWINFTISDDFQLNAIVKGIGSAPVNISIKDKMSKQEIIDFHFDDPDYFSEKRILWPTLSTRQRNFIRSLWEQALADSRN